MAHYASPVDPARMERMQSTYRPGAFFSYFGIPDGTSRQVYHPPAAASPQKKLAQLKQLVEQGLITADDYHIHERTSDESPASVTWPRTTRRSRDSRRFEVVPMDGDGKPRRYESK